MPQAPKIGQKGGLLESASRRRFVARVGMAAAGCGAVTLSRACEPFSVPALDASDRVNTWSEITTYNNFYEFSTDKEAVRHLAAGLQQRPWQVKVDGEVENPREWSIEEITKHFPSAERVFRMRCVEGWSRLVPWTGFSLCELIEQAQPTNKAAFVKFTALHDPAQMIGQRSGVLEWPYVEALTFAEAMHPMTSLVTGLNGRALPPQNGGPIRLAVPWKYGYKSIKCVVHITLTRDRPETTWTNKSPEEYGFYGNVNPHRPHPRWSQARELRIGEMKKRRTMLFNGYADQVAGLYRGMDLNVDF